MMGPFTDRATRIAARRGRRNTTVNVNNYVDDVPTRDLGGGYNNEHSDGVYYGSGDIGVTWTTHNHENSVSVHHPLYSGQIDWRSGTTWELQGVQFTEPFTGIHWEWKRKNIYEPLDIQAANKYEGVVPHVAFGQSQDVRMNEDELPHDTGM